MERKSWMATPAPTLLQVNVSWADDLNCRKGHAMLPTKILSMTTTSPGNLNIGLFQQTRTTIDDLRMAQHSAPYLNQPRLLTGTVRPLRDLILWHLLAPEIPRLPASHIHIVLLLKTKHGIASTQVLPVVSSKDLEDPLVELHKIQGVLFILKVTPQIEILLYMALPCYSQL